MKKAAKPVGKTGSAKAEQTAKLSRHNSRHEIRHKSSESGHEMQAPKHQKRYESTHESRHQNSESGHQSGAER